MNSKQRGLFTLFLLLLVLLNTFSLFLLHHKLSNFNNTTHSRRDDTVHQPVTNSRDYGIIASHTNDTVIQYFREAGVKLRHEEWNSLPSWAEIESSIGKRIVASGSERCETYRKNVPPLRRIMGASGMFNTGTNLVTQLLKANCIIPERYAYYGPNASKEKYGIRWQVPWGKHTPVAERANYSAPLAVNMTKEDALPVVTIRNPFDWMSSMCKNSYTARWSMHEHKSSISICPHLVYTNGTLVEVNAKLADKWLRFDSLAHLWNEWYNQYDRDSDFPFIMVRFEDLVFRQYATTQTICSCAGGETKPKADFKYIVNSAKTGPGHGAKSEKTDMVHAWIKYGKQKEVRSGYSDLDWEASLKYLSKDLIEKLQYKYPPDK